MAKQDEILADLEDVKQAQAEAALAAENIAQDIDEILALVQAGAGLDEIAAKVKEVQATAHAQADALKVTSEKWPGTPPAPPTT